VKWLVYGARPLYTAELVEIIARCGDTFTGAIDNLPADRVPATHGASDGASAWLRPTDLTNDALEYDAIAISASPPGIRKALRDEIRARGVDCFRTLIDPTATVAESATVGAGVTINAHVVVGAEAILDEFVQINRSSSVGHHARLSSFVTLGPGVTVASSVTLEPGVFVGAGATILPRVTIGHNAVVGAGAVVTTDVPALSLVVGNPARLVRTETTGYQGFTV
jgi:sugar O-acyltransferase (sialic acid O-acetyltransferase NeuD family)